MERLFTNILHQKQYNFYLKNYQSDSDFKNSKDFKESSKEKTSKKSTIPLLTMLEDAKKIYKFKLTPLSYLKVQPTLRMGKMNNLGKIVAKAITPEGILVQRSERMSVIVGNSKMRTKP